MVFKPFKKSTKCLVTDELFLEITWEEGKGPEDDGELLGIIEGLDQKYITTFEHGIEESLPYLTFLQAELLFRELRTVYGSFQLKQVAICHLEGREAVSEGEVFARNVVIDANYRNILTPLMASILTDAAFRSYTYQEKRDYFVNQVNPVYRESLGLQESALPLFPEEGEQLSPAPAGSAAPASPSAHALPAGTLPTTSPPKPVSFKKVYLLLSLVGLLAVVGIGLTVLAFNRLSTQSEQVLYLHDQLENLQQLEDTEHRVDVFSRYFLPTYYSGNKEALTEFLSDGDAKYTAPQEGTLQSVILETITYDSESQTYQVTYVLALKEEETSRSLRLSFSVEASEEALYGFVVTTEPTESNYLNE